MDNFILPRMTVCNLGCTEDFTARIKKGNGRHAMKKTTADSRS